jgi:hypothetical protein
LRYAWTGTHLDLYTRLPPDNPKDMITKIDIVKDGGGGVADSVSPTPAHTVE